MDSLSYRNCLLYTSNMIMVTIPGAMEKDLTHPIYWGSRIFAIIAAFIVAFPVNSWLLKKGKGHARMHEHMYGRHHTEE